jgi:peptidoglycan/LPS O-acetylase OafA/YrhL
MGLAAIVLGRASVSASASVASPSGLSRTSFRDDIQGLRAVAVLVVLGFHAGLPFLEGGFVGVDVFFVISGYLITGLLLREIANTGTVDLTRFWARRAKRLLPATAVVLMAVAVGTIAFLPMTRWGSIARDIAASALYGINWRLAGASVDYLQSEEAASPVQHFWSLAVEEQFYVFWPLLMLGLVIAHKRFTWPLTRTLGIGVALVAIPSLAWSVHLTSVEAGPAYFVSTTRAWELAVGAAIAIGAHRLEHVSDRVAQILTVAGLTAIAVAVVTFDSSTAFPGYAALLPTLGAAAVIVGGARVHRAAALLSVRPMREIGALSYSLYLWHWPALVIAGSIWGDLGGGLTAIQGTAIVIASALPAWLTYKFVEHPIHHAPTLAGAPWRALAAGAACTAIALGAAVMVANALPNFAQRELAAVHGAGVLGDRPANDPDGRVVDRVDYMIPSPLDVTKERAYLDGRLCLVNMTSIKRDSCTYGPADATLTIAVVGDSKMHQWLPALEMIADAQGWRLVTFLKSACPLATRTLERQDREFKECTAYNQWRLQTLMERDDIDVILTSQRATATFIKRGELKDRRAEMVKDLAGLWRDFETRGKDVVVLVDNPSPAFNMVECVAQHYRELSRCAFDRRDGTVRSGASAQLPAANSLDAVDIIDVSDWICPGRQCPAVIGHVLIYREGSHLTSTYVKSLAPRLEQALVRALPAG